MSAEPPFLTEILTKLGDDWSIARNRTERYRTKDHVTEDDVEQFGIAVDEGQKHIGASDPSSKTVGDLRDTLGKRACEEESQLPEEESQLKDSEERLERIRVLRQLRALLEPDKLSKGQKNELLGLTLDEAKEWMRQQADDWDKDAWEQEDEGRGEAFHNHPFMSVLERVTVWTGISIDDLRKAALKHFNGYSDFVGKLWRLDDKGQTRELWEWLVRECPSVLLQAGLMPEKPMGEPPPPSGTDEGEGNGGGAEAKASKKGEETNRYTALDNLEPAHRKAWLSFVYAESKRETRLEDRQAWEWLTENGIDEPDKAKLKDYELPAFDTWARYLRIARNAVGEQKYTPRTAKQPGRSIVSADEHEPQKTNDE